MKNQKKKKKKKKKNPQKNNKIGEQEILRKDKSGSPVRRSSRKKGVQVSKTWWKVGACLGGDLHIEQILYGKQGNTKGQNVAQKTKNRKGGGLGVLNQDLTCVRGRQKHWIYKITLTSGKSQGARKKKRTRKKN